MATPDAAASELLNYGSVGAMLVLTVLAIMWLASVFKKTTEEHTVKILEITKAHSLLIAEKDEKHDIQIEKLFSDFAQECKENAALHREELNKFVAALDANTKILNDLYRVIEKRGINRLETYPPTQSN